MLVYQVQMLRVGYWGRKLNGLEVWSKYLDLQRFSNSVVVYVTLIPLQVVGLREFQR